MPEKRSTTPTKNAKGGQVKNIVDVFYPQIAPDKVEQANITNGVNRSQVQFSKVQTVYTIDAKPQRVHERQPRSRGDPWRRYGTLQTIHKIGGWVFTPGRQRKDKAFTYVKPGTRLDQPPPEQKPIMTLSEFFKRPVMTPQSLRTVDSIRVQSLEEQGTEDTQVIDAEEPCNSLSLDGNKSLKEVKKPGPK
ncbi:hypothetical protein M3Y97_00520000 [Aphelenchoides bicaudatus]|nr:hypothetical protein M3Y97_00520000 [Aphelenchoides bicaudatus]